MGKRVKIFLEGGAGVPNYVVSHLSPETVEFTSLEDCDVVLSSQMVWGSTDAVQHQAALNGYAKSPKPVVAFWVTDYEWKMNIPPGVTLHRTSIRKGVQAEREQLLPYVFEPFKRPFAVLPPTPRPIIGFCGLPSPPRKPFLEYMRTRPELDCRFIERSQFWGGKPHDPEIVRDYEENILASHFTLCNRGAGAFSMRFYHVLGAGRIPVVIDTELVFPLEGEINWDEICVRASTPEEMVERVLQFYRSRDMREVQRKCLEVHQKYFEPARYFERVFSAYAVEDK